jgi:hypothetical protein
MDSFARWSRTYQRIQDAGKSVYIQCCISEVENILNTMKPEGLALMVEDAPDEATANAILSYSEKHCQ